MRPEAKGHISMMLSWCLWGHPIFSSGYQGHSGDPDLHVVICTRQMTPLRGQLEVDCVAWVEGVRQMRGGVGPEAG